jgi:hypothetical protein
MVIARTIGMSMLLLSFFRDIYTSVSSNVLRILFYFGFIVILGLSFDDSMQQPCPLVAETRLSAQKSKQLFETQLH